MSTSEHVNKVEIAAHIAFCSEQLPHKLMDKTNKHQESSIFSLVYSEFLQTFKQKLSISKIGIL